jgi:tRNA-specific 2-thiouridylase
MRVLAALSGGVDSSVAAALLRDHGHEVVGATMKLWGGVSDSGCCSVADVNDARRVADKLGIDHHVFNFSETFEEKVVAPYVDSHAAGLTPNPCIECNRHLKFRAFLDRAMRLGFDSVATGHHAWVDASGGTPRLVRGADRAKDQSYVLSCLTAAELSRLVLPIGRMTKAEVRALAASRDLVTAGKPDSQDVCFIAGGTGGRQRFLRERLSLHPADVVDSGGAVVGRVDAVELVTVGQRRGLGVAAGDRRFAVRVDVAGGRVEIGAEAELLADTVDLGNRTWVHEALPEGAAVTAQASAHGRPWDAVVTATGLSHAPRRRVAPGHTVALYVGDEVVGSGVVVPAAAAA